MTKKEETEQTSTLTILRACFDSFGRAAELQQLIYVSLSCLSALTMWTCEGEAPIQPLMNVGVSRLWSGCMKDGKFPRKRKGAVLSTLEQGLRADDRAGPFGRTGQGS